MNFTEMGLRSEIVKAIGELGFESPTPIQEECIPFLIENSNDLIANAQTGTGKTAAFGLPILENISAGDLFVQAIILAPTRELTNQITKDLKNYAKYLPAVNIVPVYGGASMDTQIRELRKGGQIVVGTPGRVRDLIKRKILKLGNISHLVLDEADEMLSMGFKEELDEIISKTSPNRQTLLFSATMPKTVVKIANDYMSTPHTIQVDKVNTGAENVRHIYYQVAARDKYLALKRVVDLNPGIYGIVFTRTRSDAKEVAEKLMKDGYNADALHGDLSQPQREYVMARFRSKNLQILVATDVAARGLDVDNLSHVINYNLPDDPEVYVHRSGRTGRAGKSGVSISIIHGRENQKIKQIEKMLGKQFNFQKVPMGKEICKKQLFHLIDNMEKVEVDEKQIEPFMAEVNAKLEWLSREDLIKRFVSVEFNRFLEYYSDAKDLNLNHDQKRSSDRKKDKGRDRDREDFSRGKKRKKDIEYSRFYINLGTKNGINPVKLMGLLNKNKQLQSIEIGDIELFKKFSFFEVDKNYEKEVLNYLDKKDYQGLPLKLELSNAPAKKSQSKNQRRKPDNRDPRRRNNPKKR
jgi:ATP-dependent RNA helicase DeaD